MMTGLFMANAAHRMAQDNRTASSGERAARVATEVRTKTESLGIDVEKLFMITEAMWTIIKEELDYKDEDLGSLIQQIDMRSGKLDGKRVKQVNPACPQCNRTLMGKHSVCLYCGASVARDPFA